MIPEESGAPSASPESAASDDEPYQQMQPEGLGRVAVFIDWPNIFKGMPEVDLTSLINALHQTYGPELIRTYAQFHRLPEVPLGYTQPICRRKRDPDGRPKDIDPWIINDMWEYRKKYQTLVLLSGDSDYCYTLLALGNRQKRIIVHGPTNGTSEIYSRKDSPVVYRYAPLASLLKTATSLSSSSGSHRS